MSRQLRDTRLEELYGDSPEVHAAELAHHFSEAEAVLGTEKLVHYSLMAGDRALAAFAWEEALAHFERGLAAKGATLAGTEPAPDADAAALLFGLGRAQFAILERSQFPKAVANLGRAFDYYFESGDVSRAVAVAEHPFQSPVGQRSGAGYLLNRALAIVPADSPVQGRLLSRYGRELGRNEGDYNGARQS